MSEPVIAVSQLSHGYSNSRQQIAVFENLNFTIEKSNILAIRGPSGCGKTTLLLACGGMQAPNSGSVLLSGQNLYELSSAARASFRSNQVGYLFQTLELIPYLSILDNTRLSAGVDTRAAEAWLIRMGLADRLVHKPFALSQGERQRAALARALAHQPSLVVCDEPTGNLDDQNTEIVFTALREFADDGGAVLIASHDSMVESIADSVLQLPSKEHSKQTRSIDDSHDSPNPASARQGSASKLVIFLISSILLVLALGMAALRLRPDAARKDSQSDRVKVYCAAGVAKPVEKVIAQYNRLYQANIELVRTGGSGELLGQVTTEFETGMADAADLYLSADDQLLKTAHLKSIVSERFPLAEQRPVIAVRADSQLEFDSLRELIFDNNVRFGLASERAAVGKLVRRIAKNQSCLDELESRKTTDAENVMTLAQALATGSLDAAIIWDTTVNQLNQLSDQPQLKIATVADQSNTLKSNIGVGVISSSRSVTSALKFCRFLTGAEESKKAFQEFGFKYIQGDPWEEVPEIHLYCGSMFTPVLEDSIREFASREGVNIYPRWQGCGKLVASIEGTQDRDLFPDAFLACDVSFLDRVQDQFHPRVMVSSNDIVLAVRRECSTKLTSPRDLVTSGVRFGICDPQQSALGSLTKNFLDRPPFENLYGQIYQQANVIVDVGPTLISQLMAEGLDAAIVYRSNVMADPKASSDLEIIEIDSKFARAQQPWAISRETPNSRLMNRLFEWISREQVKNRFVQFGFRDGVEQRKAF